MLYESVLTPQQGLSVRITTNDTVKAYLLEVSYQTIYNWINEAHPQSTGTELFQFWNETYLIEFLEANPQVVAIQKEIGKGETALEYMPTKMVNVTVVFHNPNSSFAEVNYEGFVFLTMAPKVKMQTLSQITIPFGFVLATPWIINSFKRTKRSVL